MDLAPETILHVTRQRPDNHRYGSFSFANEEEDPYFMTHAKPDGLDVLKKRADHFIRLQCSKGRPVVLVTSGGSTVPLENQTVRFIDNFSAGTRGACSGSTQKRGFRLIVAEYFIEAGYAVIFLHRKFSLLPYSRHYSHTTNCFLDFMVEGPNGSVEVDPQYAPSMLPLLRKYKQAKKDNLLLLIDFLTVHDYLFQLRLLAHCLQPLGASALYYLAAAVSDFHIPPSRMAEHKIQSEGGGNTLTIIMDPVPKFLRHLVEKWAPFATIISFKLETDPKLLIQKARDSLIKYQHQLVIGNMLSTRKTEVVLVTETEETWIRTEGKDIDIESLIIPKCIELHRKRMQEGHLREDPENEEAIEDD